MDKKTKKTFWTMPKTRKFKSFKKRQDNEYYLTEVRLNKEIKEFREMFNSLSYPLSVDEYDDMDSRRLKIKFLFSKQEKKVWNKSDNRRRIYLEQLAFFKHVYVKWKHITYPIYLERHYGVPHHTTFFVPWFLKKKDKNKFISVVANGLV